MPASFMCFTVSLLAPPTPIINILLMAVKLVIFDESILMLLRIVSKKKRATFVTLFGDAQFIGTT